MFYIWKVTEYCNIKLESYRELFIYLICGKKLDYVLLPRVLDDIVHLCRKADIKYIVLEPVNEELKEHYVKYGFENHTNYAGTKLIVLDVSKSRISPDSKRIKIRIRIRTQKQKQKQ